MTIVPTTLTTGSLTPEYKTLIRSTPKSNTFYQLSMAMTIKHQNISDKMSKTSIELQHWQINIWEPKMIGSDKAIFRHSHLRVARYLPHFLQFHLVII
jgi:hypothetical protein